MKYLLWVAAVTALVLTPNTAIVKFENEKKFVAKARSLNPPPYVASKPAAVVHEEVVRVPGPPPAAQGLRGYVLSGNNCVTCAAALAGRRQAGNAGTWRATHSVPRPGSILILRPGEQGAGSFGHVAVVVGVRGPVVEVAHCNYPGKTSFADNGRYF